MNDSSASRGALSPWKDFRLAANRGLDLTGKRVDTFAESRLQRGLEMALSGSGHTVHSEAYCRGPHSKRRPMRADLHVAFAPDAPLAMAGLPTIAIEVKSSPQTFADITDGIAQASDYMQAYAWTAGEGRDEHHLVRPDIVVVATFGLLAGDMSDQAVAIASRIAWRHGVALLTVGMEGRERLQVMTNAAGTKQVTRDLLPPEADSWFASALAAAMRSPAGVAPTDGDL